MQSALWNVRIADDVTEVVRDPIRLITATLVTGKAASVIVVDTESKTDYFIARLTESRPTINLAGVIIEPDFQLKIEAAKGASVELFGQPELEEDDCGSNCSHDHEHDHDHAHAEEEDFDSDMLEEMGSEIDSDEEEAAIQASLSKKAKVIEAPAKKTPEPKKETAAPKKEVAKEEVAKESKKDQKKTEQKPQKKKIEQKPVKPIDNSAEKKAAEAALAVLNGVKDVKADKAGKTPAAAAAAAGTPMRKQLDGGVFYEQTKAPHPQSQQAFKGNKISLRYVGRLKNGKKFDSGVLDVKVGAGDVIKGFDAGLVGIAKGEERKIFIPAKMGYGSKKMGPIPANSDLIFDVSCVNVK